MPVQTIATYGESHAEVYPHDHLQTEKREKFHEGKDSHAHKALDSSMKTLMALPL